MMWLKTSLNLTISTTGLILIFYSVVNFMLFLSDPNSNTTKTPVKGNVWITSTWSLFLNMCLLSLFVLSHSLMALPNVKKFISSFGLNVIQRSIYTIVTALVLQVMLRYWQPVQEIALWRFNVNNKFLWWFFVTVHLLLWIIIYIGNICRDINELIGIKQVYYSIRKLPNPNAYKSADLQRLDAHMRHPSVLGFLLIFWIIPVMSLDRLLLAIILSIYMLVAWNTDEKDYQYQEIQYIKKFHELDRL